MEVYWNLYINLIGIPADDFIDEVTNHLKSIPLKWHRDTELEAHHDTLSLPHVRYA